MNSTTRITRVSPSPQEGKFIIPLVPYKTVEGGMDFRGDYCFDSKDMECPLFGICALVIKDSNVIQALLNCHNLRYLSEETREKLKTKTTEMVPHTYPYAVSTLRENALCANIPELDPQDPSSPNPNTNDDSSWPRYGWEDRKDIN